MANDNTTPIQAASQKKRSFRIIKWLWAAFAAATVFSAVFFILVYNGVIGYMPPVEELKNPQDKLASVIFTADGKEMGRYFRGTGNRV